MLNSLRVYFSSVLIYLCVKNADAFKIPKPTETQARWLDYEVGAIVHFNMQTFDRSMQAGKFDWLRMSRIVGSCTCKCPGDKQKPCFPVQ